MNLVAWGVCCIVTGFSLSHFIARGVVERLLEEIEALEEEVNAFYEDLRRADPR